MRNKRTLLAFLLLLIFATGVWWGVTRIRSFFIQREQNKKTAQIIPKIGELTITLLEGWTVLDIATYLDKKNIVPAEDFLKVAETLDADSYPFLSTTPQGKNLEGFLFPDTYRIAKGSTSEEIIAKLLANFQKKFSLATSDAIQKNNRYVIPKYEDITIKNKNNLSTYEILTLASIIEKEAGSSGTPEELLEERKTIAGIFYNRLQISQALESDATINYITGAGRPSPTNKDLATTSPYNTYRNLGLPPGPICNPSLSSIMAALRPNKTGYYYFLHKQPSGDVVYSRTFEEHKNNKFKYLK